MSFEEFIKTVSFALSEGSIYERLRRNPSVEFDPYIFHASLIYDEQAREILAGVHREYMDVAQKYHLPTLVTADTWRASQERIDLSKFKGRRVNQDNIQFMKDLRDEYADSAQPIFIVGQMGPRGDAYKPEEALSKTEAESFHRPQLDALAESGVDLLFAATLPALTEAQGIASAMSGLGLPYMLSFVIRPEGTLLDGTPLSEAMDRIDNSQSTPPTGYAMNCIHPQVFASGMSTLDEYHRSRIFSFQANTANLRPEELNEAKELITEEPAILAELILDAHRSFHTLFMGGCCGTDTRHIEQLAQKYTFREGKTAVL
jgi:homocysteine S-methyltransferase